MWRKGGFLIAILILKLWKCFKTFVPDYRSLHACETKRRQLLPFSLSCGSFSKVSRKETPSSETSRAICLNINCPSSRSSHAKIKKLKNRSRNRIEHIDYGQIVNFLTTIKKLGGKEATQLGKGMDENMKWKLKEVRSLPSVVNGASRKKE